MAWPPKHTYLDRLNDSFYASVNLLAQPVRAWKPPCEDGAHVLVYCRVRRRGRQRSAIFARCSAHRGRGTAGAGATRWPLYGAPARCTPGLHELGCRGRLQWPTLCRIRVKLPVRRLHGRSHHAHIHHRTVEYSCLRKHALEQLQRCSSVIGGVCWRRFCQLLCQQLLRSLQLNDGYHASLAAQPHWVSIRQRSYTLQWNVRAFCGQAACQSKGSGRQ